VECGLCSLTAVGADWDDSVNGTDSACVVGYAMEERDNFEFEREGYGGAAEVGVLDDVKEVVDGFGLLDTVVVGDAVGFIGGVVHRRRKGVGDCGSKDAELEPWEHGAGVDSGEGFSGGYFFVFFTSVIVWILLFLVFLKQRMCYRRKNPIHIP
jgi:hypothetical protein